MPKFLFLPFCILILMGLSAGCADKTTSNFVNHTDSPQKIPITLEYKYGINLSAIPVETPEYIRTNGSYIAAIAFQDKRALELLKHGGKPEAIAVIFHSCPRNNPYCDQDPKLIMQYRNIRFAFTVDEKTGEVRSGSAMVPNAPDPNKSEPTYYKTRDMSNQVEYVYLGNTLVMAYDNVSFLFLDTSYDDSLYTQNNQSNYQGTDF